LADDENDDPVAVRRARRALALYIAGFIFVSSLLLILNVGMVYSLYTGIAIFLTESFAQQIGQLLLLIGPFALLFLEWYLYDLLRQPFRRYR
jgi:hypothetical protein